MEGTSSAAEGMYAGVDFILDYIEKRVKPSLGLLVGRQTGVAFLEKNPRLHDAETPAVLKAARTILGFKEAAAVEPLSEDSNN